MSSYYSSAAGLISVGWWDFLVDYCFVGTVIPKSEK